MTTEDGAARRRAGLLFAFGSAAGYGINIVSAQIAGQAGLNGTLIVFYRVFLMLALALAAAALLRASLSVPRREWPAMALFGLATTGVGAGYLSSVAYVPVSVAAVVFYTYPVIVVLTEPLLGRGVRPERIAIALAAFAGVALVVGPDWHGLDPRGLALAFVASLSAVVQFYSAAAMAGTSVPAKVIWSHLLVLPVTAIILTSLAAMLPPQALLLAPYAVAITIAGYVLAFLFQLLALARIAPGPAALAFCAEPVIALLVAAVVLGERLGPSQYLGCGIVLAALVANVIMEQKSARLAPA